MEQGTSSQSTSVANDDGSCTLQPKHKVFLSHSGAQKEFVHQLCVDLQRCDRHAFFDQCRHCLPIGKEFPPLLFEAIEQCEVGVVVLSEEFFTSKWPMLELVRMADVQRRKPSFTILPIFLGIRISEYRDVDNHLRWSSFWRKWAEGDSRIDVGEWENAFKLLGRTNALEYDFDSKGPKEVKFRGQIVEAICELVPPETRFEDSHVQGRSRLCKVIYERIASYKTKIELKVHMLGIYGVGGIGKTTLCKAMCNYLSKEYRDKVCHVELGSGSEEEVFKEVLGKLGDKDVERLGATHVDQYRDHLKRDMKNVKVFLTIDNVSSATSRQALDLLGAKYGDGSVLLVIARSLEDLTSLGMDASECMEMLELESEEARSLFLYHAKCVPHLALSNKDDVDLISSCIERCHFKKGDDISYHYHPLALQVLGEQLRCIGYDPSDWWSILHRIDSFNPFGEHQHPVFSILRSSFDALNTEHQLLFMDVALFAPYRVRYMWNISCKWSIFEWIGMVHGIPLKIVMARLKNLKKKSLLGNLGDGLGRIGVHDLWQEFATLETQFGKFKDKQCVFERDASGETNLIEGYAERMFFLDDGLKKLEGMSFSGFSKLTVLKLCTDFGSVLELDLTSLTQLKSLELECRLLWPERKPMISIIGLGSLLQLVFLRWLNIDSSGCIDAISLLTELRVLDLGKCGYAPDLWKLISLQVVSFERNKSMVAIQGLSSRHTNLQFLVLSSCMELQSCLGVGELVMLEELDLHHCRKLERVPNLHKLKCLWKLNVGGCNSLLALPGLGDLVNLLELHANDCYKLAELPNVHKLTNLKILDLGSCKLIKSLLGLGELVCLQSFNILDCENLTELSNMSKLTNLQTLEMDQEASSQSFAGWSDLILLQSLNINLHWLHDGFNLCNFTKLERLNICRWQGQGISSLAQLVLLEYVTLEDCEGVLPDLKRLSSLQSLELQWCEFKDLSGLCNLTSLEELLIKECNELKALPDLRQLAKLQLLKVKGCEELGDLNGILGLQNLKSLRLGGLPKILELNLSQLSSLYELHLSDFANLQWLATCLQLQSLKCSGCPIQKLPNLVTFSQLHSLNCSGCPIQELPDLATCSQLCFLDCSRCPIKELPNLATCSQLCSLNCSGCPIKELPNLATCSQLCSLNCSGCPIKELPDLANFLELSAVYVENCVDLMKLTCSKPMGSNFACLDISGCKKLQALPDFRNSKKMQTLNVTNSGVVLSVEAIQDMKTCWPSIVVVTKGYSF